MITLKLRVLFSMTLALAACGGGGDDDRTENGVQLFGMSSTEALQQVISEGDESTAAIARAILEAGGFASFAELSDTERASVVARHATRERAAAGFPPPPPAPSPPPPKVPPPPAPAPAPSPSLSGVTACVPYLDVFNRNREHLVGAHKYYVDAMGRPSYGNANFYGGSIPVGLRDSCSTTVGTWGAPPAGSPWPGRGYVGGHLIAASLGGAPARINLTPQDYDVNISTFQKIEYAVRRCAANPKWVTTYNVLASYGNSPLTPNSYTVFIRVMPSTWWSGTGPQGGVGSMILPNLFSQNLNTQVDAFLTNYIALCSA